MITKSILKLLLKTPFVFLDSKKSSLLSMLLFVTFLTCIGQNYQISNTPTNPDANGIYQPNGTNDGVTAYRHLTNNFSMYRVPGLAWVICSDNPPFVNCLTFIDFKSGSATDNTPPIGAWDALTQISTALPVELTSFKLNIAHENVLLEWKTATEINNSGFEIEKSNNALSWKTIGFVEGKGTSFEDNQYKFEDKTPQEGINYYRLKQIDFDGQYEYSTIENIVINARNKFLNIFPNPVTDGILSVSSPQVSEANPIHIQLFDITGKSYYEMTSNDTQTVIKLDWIPFGMYYLNAKIGNEEWHEKIVYLK